MSQEERTEAIIQINRKYWWAKERMLEAKRILQSISYSDEVLRQEIRRSKVANEMRMQECEAWLRNEYLTNEQLKELISPYGIL